MFQIDPIMKTAVVLFSGVLAVMSLTSCLHLRAKTGGEQDTASIEKEVSDDEAIEQLVMRWNEAVNSNDFDQLKDVFAMTVFLYTRNMTAEEAARTHQDAKNKTPGFRQEIVGDVSISNIDGTKKRVEFTKATYSDKKGNKTYPCYFEVEKRNGIWKITKESDEVTDSNLAKRKSQIPSDAVQGDFDGDGTEEYVWITGKKDSDGYYINPRLKSDNPTFDGLKWPGEGINVELTNFGKLHGDTRDYLGAIPYGMAGAWRVQYTYTFTSGSWKEALDPFSAYIALDDEPVRVKRIASRPGYVTIYYNDMDLVASNDPDPLRLIPATKRLKY